MLIVERESGDVIILEPRGRVDASGREEFYRVMSGIVEKGATKMLLDLSQVPYMDSTGLGVLFGVYTSLKKKGGEIRLAGVSDRMRKLLTLVCLDGMIEVSETVEDALEKFGRGA
jgi:anti-sigma B factor antagonist